MMLGNVAPAPLSFTCARAGAASASAAATAMRGDFVIPVSSSELERELSLEQRLGPVCVVGGVQGIGLIVRVVPIEQQPPVGRQLVRRPTDDARLLVDDTSL